MKKIVAGIVVLGFLGYAFVTPKAATKAKNEVVLNDEVSTEGIQFFEGTWAEALKKAESEKKLVFLDAYASWCGPCKLMAKNTFTDEEVGEFFNKNFVNMKLDMEKSTEGPRLSRKFGLRAYPTLYFVNGSESVVFQTLGYQKPAQLIDNAKKHWKLINSLMLTIYKMVLYFCVVPFFCTKIHLILHYQ